MKAESRSMKDDNRLLKGISMNPILQHHAVRSLIVNANHVDVKQVHSQAELREFVAGFVNYNPAWIRALYGIRAFAGDASAAHAVQRNFARRCANARRRIVEFFQGHRRR